MELLNLENKEVSTTLDINQENTKPLLNEESIKEKTDRVSLALPDKDHRIISDLISRGEEDLFNIEVGKKRLDQDLADKRNLVTDLILNDDPDLENVVNSFSVPPLENFSKNAITKEFSKNLINTVASNTSVLTYANEPDTSEDTHKVLDIAERFVQVSSHIRDRIQQENASYEDKTLLGKTGSVLWGLIPILDTYGTYDALDGAPTSSILKGSNIEEQVKWLWLQEPDDIPILLDEAIEDVRRWAGDLAAKTYADYFLTLSSSEVFMEDVFGVLDIATSGAIKPVSALAKGTIQGVTKFGTKSSKIASSLGEVELSAPKIFAENKLLTKASGADEIEMLIPGNQNVMSILGKTDTTANNSTRKIYESALNRSEFAKRVLDEGQVIDNLNEIQLAKLAAREFDDFKEIYTKLEDSLIEYKIVPAETTADNIDRVKLLFGKLDGTEFKTEIAAKNWIGRYLPFKKENVNVVSKGSNYFIEVEKPININEPVEGIKLTTDQITPGRSWLRTLYSDGYVAALDHVKDKRTVSDISERMGKLLEEVGKPITDLKQKGFGKRVFKEFDDTLNDVTTRDPKSKVKRWKTLGEFEQTFNKRHGKFPTDEQKDAFVAYRQIYDLDWVMRNLSDIKQKMRMGVENWEIPNIDNFEGVLRKDIPWGDGDYFRVVALDENGKLLKQGSNNSIPRIQSEFQKLIDDGYQVIQAFNGVAKVKKKTSATFILNRVAKRNQLTLKKNMNYNPGNHKITRSPFYIKQASLSLTKSGKRLLTGENTIWNVYSKKQGREIVEHLENLRKLKLANDPEFDNYWKNYLPELREKDFERFDWSTPFKVTSAGQRGGYKKGLDFDEDLTNNKWNLSKNLAGRFKGERDALDVDAIYSEKAGGAIKVEPATQMSPVQAMQEGLKSSFRQHTLTDFLDKSVRNIEAEFGHILDVSSNDLKRNPVAFLSNPKFVPGSTNEEVATFKRLARALNDFLATPTKSQEALHHTKEKIVEWAISKSGPKSKLGSIPPENILHSLSDPAAFFRGVAFHAKMGLFNVKQLFLQSQILSQVASIGGLKNTAQSIPALMYSRALWANTSPKMLDDAANRMKLFGWKPEHFRESHEALSKSGWDIIGGSVAWKDIYEGPKITKGAMGRVLDLGTKPFEMGEKIGRITAWHVAYRNWRKANPNKVFDRKAIATVRLRASDLTANMTRDMNAMWQRGFMSVPTQFWGFQARVFEQMVSPASRLTKVERARLFVGLSTLYGVPVGLGAGTMVWPINESVKKYLMENGLEEEVEDSLFLESVRDGIIATGIEMASGSDFDTAPFGPAGNPFFKDVLRYDKDWYEIFGGASAGVTLDLMKSSGNIGAGIYYMTVGSDSDEDNPYALDIYDFADLLKPISSANNLMKAYRAQHLGKWVTANETVVGDVTFGESVASGIIGIELEDVTDTYLRLESVEDIRKIKNDAKREVQKEALRARRSLDSGDIDAHRWHVKKSRGIAILNGLNEREHSKAFQRGFEPETLEEASQEKLDKVLREFYERKNK